VADVGSRHPAFAAHDARLRHPQFRFVNEEGRSTFVKFHWKPKQGVQSTIWDKAVKIAGADPDFHRRDLFEAIGRGDYPEWDFGVQTFDESFASKLPYDVLDATKIIPEEFCRSLQLAAAVFPLARSGRAGASGFGARI
jgi:catalase